MKKLFICMVAIAAAAFVGCKKNNSSPSASMTCKIDGVQWTAVTYAAGIQAGSINITGKASDSSLVTISVMDDVIGAYNIGLSNTEGALGYYLAGGSSTWTSNTLDPLTGTSTCTITEVDTTDKTISGTFTCYTFNAVASTMKIFTEGTFTKIPYTTSGYTGTNSFAVKYDGTALVPTTISGAVALSKITLTASDNNFAHTVGITMPSNVTPGTYSIGSLGDSYSGNFNIGSNYLISNSGSGNLVITSHNTATKRIAGTFSFTASSFGTPVTTSSLTNGSFDITYN